MVRKYSIIYADPPWFYNQRKIYRKDGKRSHGGGGATGQYSVMKTEDICKLNVKELSADDCALFLWVTFPNLFEAKKVIEAWGFRYVTVAFVWVKCHLKTKKICKGMGYHTKSNAEICLLGLKGTMKAIDKGISSILIFPRLEHSHKPNEIRNRIVQLYGNLPRIELFARQKTEGWDVFGNEVENSISMDKLS